MTIAGCVNSGPLQQSVNDDVYVTLPPVPADLRVCFKQRVGPPEEPMTKRVIFAKLAELKRNGDDKKGACGMRLICWIEDIARGLAGPDQALPVAPDCRVRVTGGG